MARMVQEQTEEGVRRLNVSNEPVAVKKATGPNSAGDQALMDALTILIIAWVLLFVLAFSLRKYNV